MGNAGSLQDVDAAGRYISVVCSEHPVFIECADPQERWMDEFASNSASSCSREHTGCRDCQTERCGLAAPSTLWVSSWLSNLISFVEINLFYEISIRMNVDGRNK